MSLGIDKTGENYRSPCLFIAGDVLIIRFPLITKFRRGELFRENRSGLAVGDGQSKTRRVCSGLSLNLRSVKIGAIVSKINESAGSDGQSSSIMVSVLYPLLLVLTGFDRYSLIYIRGV